MQFKLKLWVFQLTLSLMPVPFLLKDGTVGVDSGIEETLYILSEWVLVSAMIHMQGAINHSGPQVSVAEPYKSIDALNVLCLY